MKRAWTKKIKAVPACAADDNNLERHLKPVQPVKQRVRTSATVIGLAFSMGASSLLVTRQSDRAPASEPVGNELQSSIVSRSQPTLAVTAASAQLIDESRIVTDDGAQAKQKVTLNRLKQKSNRLKEILAELGHSEPHNSSAPIAESLNRLKEIVADLMSEESNNSSAPAKNPMELSSGVNKAHSNQVAPLVVSTTGQQTATQDTLKVAATMVSALPKSAVNTPIVAASGSLNYRVKDGDTLTAIANNHGVSLAKILKANHLTAPDRLQINQTIAIPGLQLRSHRVVTTYPQQQVYSLSPRVRSGDDLPKFAVNTPTAVVASGSLKYQVRPGDTLTEIAHLHGVSLKALVNANNLTAPDWLQINQRLTIPAFKYSSAAAPWAKDVSVPPEPLARTPSLNVTVYGIGGSVSEETTNQTRTSFDKSQLPESTAAKLEGQSNPYVKNLQADIERLQHKYYAQQTVIKPNLNKQAAETLKPAIQKRHLNKTTPVLPRARVVTAPIGVDASESLQYLRGKQVSPELPPLAAVDTYMPSFNNAAQFKGYIWPTKGVLSSGYGWRWGRMHKGIDIAAPIGTPVVAAAPGVVIKAGWNSGGYGRLVDIKHPDGTFTRYAHNNRILVHPGQEVEQGEPISEMGSSGRSTGPHLHFEVHPAGKGAVNPIAFLKRK